MIVVCGATGQVGSAVVTELLGAAHEVRALVQPGMAIPWPDRAGLDVSVADFDDATAMRAAIGGAKALFMMSPPDQRQVEWQQIQIDAAQAAGVTRVVKLSAFDTGPDTRLTMGRWHWAGEQALRASRLPYAILRPQYFMENLLHDEMRLRAGVVPTFIEDGRPVGMVAAADVGSVAAALLVSGELDGQVLVPTGPAAITTADVASALSGVLGLTVVARFVEGDAALAALLASGRPDWHARDVLMMCQDASALVTTDVARLTGRPARDVTSVVAGRFDLATR